MKKTVKLRTTAAGPNWTAIAGATVSIDAKEADELINGGYAFEVKPAPAAAPAAAEQTVTPPAQSREARLKAAEQAVQEAQKALEAAADELKKAPEGERGEVQKEVNRLKRDLKLAQDSLAKVKAEAPEGAGK